MDRPLCSVVIPSRNRAAMLGRVLEGLTHQTAPPDRFEVIVVLDGSTDQSDDVVRRFVGSSAFALRCLRQERAGAGSARNRGAAAAAAPVVLFLDDDVVPDPDLVMHHLRHHVEDERIAVLGDCPVARRRPGSLYELVVWAWWEDMYHWRAQPDHRPRYSDFCAGNVSLRRDDLFAVGSFDPGFRGYGAEDYELGYRLLRAGVRFLVDPEARAVHHHQASLAHVLRAARDEGVGDVYLGRLHVELRSGLRLMRPERLENSRAPRLAFIRRRRGAALAWLARQALRVYELTGRRTSWVRAFGFLRAHAYWCGVRDALGSRAALDAYRAGAPPPPVHEIEIGEGLPDPLPSLSVDGPNRIIVMRSGRRLGEFLFHAPVQEPLAPALVYEIGRRFHADLVDAPA